MSFGRSLRRSATAVLAASVVAACASEGSGQDAAAAPGEPAAVVPAADPEIAAPAALPSLHRGIDVSHHCGTVDWERVAVAGHTFAFVKATEGVDAVDPMFHLHWPALKKAGLARGAYHFYVTEDDPEEQARLFLDTVDLGPGDLAPVVDLELIGHDTQPGLVDRVKVFLAAVERETGGKPIIYTAPNFWDEHMSDEFGGYPLWVAEYGVEAPRLPRGWDAWHLWQWEEDAAVPGVENGADVSHVNRSGVDLSVLFLGD